MVCTAMLPDSQLGLEDDHQDGEADPDGDPVGQAEEEGGQEGHHPHTLGEGGRHMTRHMTSHAVTPPRGGTTRESTRRLHSPAGSSATGSTGRRAAAACSSGSPRSELRAPTATHGEGLSGDNVWLSHSPRCCAARGHTVPWAAVSGRRPELAW